MAEKYGTVPDRWTKEWWAYFWEYYKWHTIFTAFIVVCIAATIVQYATRDRYDMTVTYTGYKMYSDEEADKIQNILSQYTEDVDGNGEKSVFFQDMTFMGTPGSEEYDYAIQSKLDLQFVDDVSYLFIYDEKVLKTMMERDSVSEQYTAVEDWADIEIDESLLYKAEDGKNYAVKLSDSVLLEQNGIYHDDLYVLVRQNYSDKAKNTLAYKSAERIANELIK